MSSQQKILSCLESLAAETSCKLTEAPTATQKWLLENSRLPLELISILAHSWPSQTMWIGNYDLWTRDDLSESKRAKIAFAGGFFMVGAAGNGDLLVVRRRQESIDDCELGLISHEELWENESSLETIYEPICRGLLTLLKNASIEGALPLDYYDARKKRRRSTG